MPGCVTLKLCPAMVSVPVRELVLLLAAALNATVPLPAAARATGDRQPGRAVAHAGPRTPGRRRHARRTCAAACRYRTARRRERKRAVDAWLRHAEALSGNRQVPVRELVLLLAVALYATVPVPLPLAPPVTVSQDVLLLTPVHGTPSRRRHTRRTCSASRRDRAARGRRPHTCRRCPAASR